MTDFTTRRREPAATSSKRSLLIAGAREVFHQQGVERTTLNDVAEASGVPVGNIYYYFKTKDELVDAVIDDHMSELQDFTRSLDRLKTPQARLKAWTRQLMSQSELVARHGCPQGSLCSELDKLGDVRAEHAADLMRSTLGWAEQQFREMGRRDAHELAVEMLAAYQGAALLANTLRDPDLMRRQARRLERWVDTLS